MRKILPVIGLIVVMSSLLGCLDTESKDTFDEEDILEFGLEVLQTFFDNDKETFYSYLAEETYSLEGGGPYTVEEVRGWFDSDDYLMNQMYTQYSMEEYLETYEPEILDYKEVDSEYPGIIEMLRNLSWDFDDDDYMFRGWETKDGEEGPLWDDPLAFMVTHETGELKFKAFSD